MSAFVQAHPTQQLDVALGSIGSVREVAFAPHQHPCIQMASRMRTSKESVGQESEKEGCIIICRLA